MTDTRKEEKIIGVLLLVVTLFLALQSMPLDVGDALYYGGSALLGISLIFGGEK